MLAKGEFDDQLLALAAKESRNASRDERQKIEMCEVGCAGSKCRMNSRSTGFENAQPWMRTVWNAAVRAYGSTSAGELDFFRQADGPKGRSRNRAVYEATELA